MEDVQACFSEPARKNRGRFQPGDKRINLKGRPRKPAAARRRALNGQPLCGKLMSLFVPEGDLCRSLFNEKHPWLINMPKDVRIVAIDPDPSRPGFLVIIWSESFAEVAEGGPIPEYQPAYNGLMWRPAV